MKNFIYCETTDGGMMDFKVTCESDLKELYGWMDESCKKDDAELLEWLDTSKIGDYHNHRLGLIFRVNAT